jgi:mono/diheme cytochrome c family protein
MGEIDFYRFTGSWSRMPAKAMKETDMWKFCAVFSAFLLAGLPVSTPQDQKPAGKAPVSEFKIPPEASKLANPVKPTTSALAQAKKTYGYDCAMCHGVDGDGKGDLAADMKVKLVDYHDPASLKDFTDGDLFYIIKNGKGEMPSEGDRAKPDEIWNLVNYIHSLAKKDTSAKSKPDTP